jgi:hypothetical protein
MISGNMPLAAILLVGFCPKILCLFLWVHRSPILRFLFYFSITCLLQFLFGLDLLLDKGIDSLEKLISDLNEILGPPG